MPAAMEPGISRCCSTPKEVGTPARSTWLWSLTCPRVNRGFFFQQTIKATRQLIGGLVGGSRVQIWLTRTPETPLLRRPAAVGSEPLREAVRSLESQIPSGLSSLTRTLAAVEPWIADRNGSLPKVLVYIGGEPTPEQALVGGELSPDKRELLVQRYVDSGVVCHEFTVMTARKVPDGNLGPLPARTGGQVITAEMFLHRSEKAGITPWIQSPWYLSRLKLDPGVTQMLPETLSPLAVGSSLLIVGQWTPADQMTFEMTATTRDASEEHSIPVRGTALIAKGGDDNAYLKELVTRWNQVPNSSPWTEGSTALEFARRSATIRSEWILSQAKAALARRQLPLAEDLYQLALASEPKDLEASSGLTAVAKLRSGPDPREEASATKTVAGNESRPLNADDGKNPSADPSSRDLSKSAPADSLEEANAREKIEAQRLQKMVRDALADSQRLARTNPAAGIRMLKGTLAALEASEDPRSKNASMLRSRIEQQLRTLSRQQQRSEEEQLLRDRASAMAESRRRADREELLRQQATKELMSRYQALLDAGEYLEAERVASDVVAADPDSLVGHAGQWRANLARHYAEAEQTEAMKREQWWRAMASIDASSVPFDDRTPLVYPPAKVWEEITIRRQKYKAVDLAPVSPAEEEVREALTRPITFEFQETPLSDVINYLRDYTRVNVIPDLAAMEQVGVSLDTPVTLRLERVTLKSALRLLLRPLEMTYMVQDGVLQLTTTEVATGNLITKVYPVGDLVTPIVNFQGGATGLSGGGLGSQGTGLNSGGGGTAAPGNFNNNQNNGQGNRPRAPNRTPRGDGPDLREKVEEIIRQVGDGDAFFQKRPVPGEYLRPAIAKLVSENEHDKVIAMLQSALRHQTGEAWMQEALAISLQLSGAPAAETRDAFLSLVDLKPRSSAIRRAVAETLASLGQPAAALELLQGTAVVHPDSVNTFFDMLSIAAEAKNVESMVWAADQLLSREWTPDGDLAHQETVRLLKRTASILRAEGKLADADRLEAMASAPRIRDLEILVQWAGEADVDACVVEPGDLLCSPSMPRTVQGGVLTSDAPGGKERYVAAEAFAGKYELLLRAVWGQPTSGVVHIDIVKRKGTASEKRERHAVTLVDGEGRLTVELEEGRRTKRTPIAADEEFASAEHLRSKPTLSPKIQLQRRMAAQAEEEGNGPAANLLQPIAGPNGPFAQVEGAGRRLSAGRQCRARSRSNQNYRG
ncbi:MAG: hypothetical protein U1D30_11530 [Planctomycetota bacterium]